MADRQQNELWPEDPKGGDLVPLSRGADGKLHFSWPNAIRSTVNSVHELMTTPGDAAAGKYTPSEMQAPATRMALTMAGLGMGLPAEENSLQMFGGVRAKTANMQKLTQALTQEGRGAHPEDIWNQTGWFRGPDQKWRFEIPDHAANMTSREGGAMSSVMEHPDLYKAYPQLKSMDVAPTTAPATSGAYFPDEKRIQIGGNGKGNISTLLHETQHGVQDIEEFAQGGSPDDFLSADHHNRQFQLNQNWPKLAHAAMAIGADPANVMNGMKSFSFGRPLTTQAATDLKLVGNTDPSLLEAFRQHYNTGAQLTLEKQAANRSYENLAGEVEARNVQERHEIGYGQETAPWRTPGYTPADKQIIVMPDGRAASLAPVDHDPFAPASASTMPALVPVEHDPWQHTAEPVSHDPFATEESPQ